MRFVHLLLTAILCLGMAGACTERSRDKTKEAAESVGQDIEQGTAKAVEKTKQVGHEAADKVKETTDKAKNEADEKTRSAGQ